MADRVRRGDFLVPRDELAQAQATFDERPPQSRKRDRAFRGPITTDIETYQATNGLLFDYPGVDTPRDDPKAGVSDLPFPDEHRTPSEGMMIDQQPETLGESISDSVAQAKQQSQSLWGQMFRG